MCNEVFKGIQIVSAWNSPESRCCAGGFAECRRRGRCLLLTLLTPECSVWPSHPLLLPRLEPVVWSQHRVIWLQDDNMFAAPAFHEWHSYGSFQGSCRCCEVVAEEGFVKGSSGGTELGQDLLKCGGVAGEILRISGIAEMLCWSQVQGEESKERNVLFSSLCWTPVLFFLYITGVLCIHNYSAIQRGTTAPFKECTVKCVLERTLLQASTKQNEMHYSEKGNYSKTTYESCRWTQYVVEWLTRKHSRWPPNSTWTIWHNKTWGIVLINVAVL